MSPLVGARRIERALAGGAASRRPRLIAYLTGGYPERATFRALLPRMAAVCDAVEIGVPFSDPMADGVTIQRSSAQALARGATLRGLLDDLEALKPVLDVPVVMMSYLNPLLSLGVETLAERAAAAGVDGLVVPDLPLEEAELLQVPLDSRGLALVQLVTPLTSPERRRRVCAASRGFVYAVTRTGTTGAGTGLAPDLAEYLDAVRADAAVPVVAGFGIRSPQHVATLSGHADGAIVGSALIDELEAGRDPVELLRSLPVPT